MSRRYLTQGKKAHERAPMRRARSLEVQIQKLKIMSLQWTLRYQTWKESLPGPVLTKRMQRYEVNERKRQDRITELERELVSLKVPTEFS